jgi:hypothetical protein
LCRYVKKKQKKKKKKKKKEAVYNFDSPKYEFSYNKMPNEMRIAMQNKKHLGL